VAETLAAGAFRVEGLRRCEFVGQHRLHLDGGGVEVPASEGVQGVDHRGNCSSGGVRGVGGVLGDDNGGRPVRLKGDDGSELAMIALQPAR
jgi:hypothetical protein